MKITLDKAEIIQLDRDVVNVIVGSDKNLRVVPDTNRTLVLIPKQPGSTYFKALDNEGHVIMQRHVIIGSPKSEYIRIRRACVNGADGCRQYSVYYCPDMCHEVSVSQDEKKSSPAVPADAPSYRSPANGSSEDSESQSNNQDDSRPADIAQ
jgi:Flp pilus assembly secretin CpaC